MLLLATDSLRKRPVAGALVTNENEAETVFFLRALKKWLPKPINFITIDFSPQIESGVKIVLPRVITQKCVFHAIHLLTKGLLKELNRVKREHIFAHIEEWKELRTTSYALEKGKKLISVLQLKFKDTKYAWQIYLRLKQIFSTNDPNVIEKELFSFSLTSHFTNWNGKMLFLEKYNNIFTKRGLKFTCKGLKYIITDTYNAWRGAIRELRRKREDLKTHFNHAKYLLLMNPLNMKRYHQNELRKYLKEFPWLRSYRKTLVKLYYQFRVAPQKRVSLSFLSRLITEQSHPRLKGAVKTLIENEEQIFRFQSLHNYFPAIKPTKSIKVVDESSNRIIHHLYQIQYGMRTVENLRMRISKRLKCPIIISPSVLAKVKS